MAPSISLVAALFTSSHAGLDESSMLQMPMVDQQLGTDEDECRCPGYYQSQCEAEAQQGCVWSDAGESNEPWCQCLGSPVPDAPVIPQEPLTPISEFCCLALEASCLACQAAMSVEAFCAANPTTLGCAIPEPSIPEEPLTPISEFCCQALEASCLACQAAMSVEAFCAANPTTLGCAIPDEPAPSGTFVEFYDAADCSGGPAKTVELSASSENRCNQCWDRCAHGDSGYPAYRLRGPGTAVVAWNCIGRFHYDDAMFNRGRSFTEATGCHAPGGGGTVVLCGGGVEVEDHLTAQLGAHCR